MDKKPHICLVMEDWEKNTFFTDSLWNELQELSSSLETASSSTFADENGWMKWLIEKEPEILVTCWTTPTLPDDTPSRVPSLNYVCHLAGSVKGTVSDTLIEQGMLVSNWGKSISRTVAETGLMMAIAGLRRVSYWTLEMHTRGGWKERTSVQTGSLFCRKVGLHGFGSISQELVRLLEPFEVKISTYSPSVPDSLLEEFGVQRSSDLESLFSENDVIIELAALTEKNKGIVTEKLLRSIPAGGVFVNIGRGAVVDEEALARVAQDGQIQVCLDVYGKEPLPEDSPFRELDSVLTMPHLGGPTIDRRQDATRLGLDNIKRYLNGEPLESQITTKVYQRST